MPEDRAELRKDSKVLIAGGAITRNELRRRHGMEELPGAKGEELVTPAARKFEKAGREHA